MEIPEESKPHIFKKRISTKGEMRGLGTYSVRLLGEKYLGGKVGFTSNSCDGTTFFIDLPLKYSPQK
ncbi:ATP-binding protein [Methanolapillus ohkumae]|uniref:ATP-binding protein n=1 Tax=Methanolapillus ohkumae TaxID=3028298 RepID=UPI0030B8B371